MQILRCAKNNNAVSSNLMFSVYCIMELQILSTFLIRENSTLFRNIFDFINKNTNLQTMVMVILVLYLIQIFYLGGLLILVRRKLKQKRLDLSKSVVLRVIQFKPYLLFVVFSIVNINGLLNSQSKIIKVLSITNLLLMILQLMVIKLICPSYRFIQRNYIRRKSNSIIQWLLILVLIFITNIYDSSLYGAIIMIVRALLVGYNNFWNLQNEEIRKCQWLFPLISLQLGFLLIVQQYFTIEFFSNIINFSFAIIFTLSLSNTVSQQLSLQILKHHIYHSQLLTNAQIQYQSQKSKQIVQLSQNQLSSLLLQLRILVKIYHSKIYYQKHNTHTQVLSQKFDNWYIIFNRLVLIHKANCNDVQCQCSLLKPRQNKTNQIVQNQIMTKKISQLIQTIKFQSINNNKFKIIQNYFLIELQNKPLKTYFQIIKLSNTHLNTEETLEVENLIHETRDNFKQLFLRQKVQNTDLDVEPLFQFQDHLKDMRSRLNDMAVEYRLFYEVFANNFVQMQALKQKTRLLTEFKKHFSQEIDICLKKFDKSLELMTFCMVYFRFFDEYTNKLQKVEEKAQYLIEAFKIPLNETKRGTVDIFDPHYGAVKADLVFNPGKIVKITKNMCNLLDYSHQQLSDQKVNKLMPLMFSKNHHKFIFNFVEKGQIKIMQHRQTVVYARNSNKFIVPINLRLKVDYSSSEGMYALAFTNLVHTKSEFILMNNYGKIEEITEGIFKRFFGKALGQQNRKVKRLCMGKLLLSFNNVLKNIDESSGMVNEGLFLSSDSQDVLINYYQFPQFSKIYKGKSQNGQSSSKSFRSASSAQQTFSGTDASRTIDLSEDMSKYSIDFKEALKIYLKNFDYRKVTGFRVVYRCQDFVTSEFKCKVLQIISVRQQQKEESLIEILKQEIIDLGDVVGLQEEQIMEFKIFRQQKTIVTKSIRSIKIQNNETEQINSDQSDNLLNEKINKQLGLEQTDKNNSDTGSTLQLKQKSKKKQSLVSAFQQKPIINPTLQILLTVLILILAFILLIVSIFSIQLQSNYKDIQEDNLVLTNYRIDFLLLFGIQQLSLMYKSYNITPPKFLQQKKSMFAERMKEQLIKSTTWIDINRQGYKVVMPFKFQDIDYEEKRSILAEMNQIYTMFLSADLGHYITDNYVGISAYLLGLTSLQQVLITNASKNYKSQIHVVIGCYSFILFIVICVGIWFRRIALMKQDKIVDFLPFFKANQAKQNQLFYQKFYQVNKESQQIGINQIQSIKVGIEDQSLLGKNYDENIYSKQLLKVIKMHNKKDKQVENTTRQLIRVVKNQKNGITLKIVLFSLLVLVMCLFVIFYAEFFFSSADSKFWTYLQLKNSAFLVQLIPSRIIVLYFSNINRMLANQTLYNYPESFYRITHDRMFQLQFGLSNQQFYGTQMQEIITDHFNRQICSMIECSNDSTQMSLVKDQQVFYLAYRFANSFAYMRKIIKMLPNMTNPREEVRKWIDQNDILEVLETTEFILDLMKRSQTIITDLFTDQINLIGDILLALSLTLIPILILVLLFFRKKYIQYIMERLECTQHIFRHLSWQMLSENNYAVNYFEGKVNNSKHK